VRGALSESRLGGVRLDEVSGELATFVGRVGHTRALRGRLVDPLGLEANYVRRSDAEANWKGG
jgi:hypothetical protein